MANKSAPALPIVIVDDERDVLTSESNSLAAHGFDNVVAFQDGRKVLPHIDGSGAELVLLDLTMPQINGRELLRDLHSRYPEIPVIVLTADHDLRTAVECMQEGATDYIVKGTEEDRLVSGVRRAIELRDLKRNYGELRKRLLDDTLRHPEAFAALVTRSRKMHSLFLFVESIAATRETVLIMGETGVGKELVAEAVHRASGRDGAFVRVNVAGLDDSMFADTLFGHLKGAYTGAAEARKGLVSQATDGTVFLDEIGDLSPTSQVKLLQLLERREFRQIGSDLVRRTNARFVVATNRDLELMVRHGDFRADLYYRLATHSVYVPSLRDRLDDLAPLLDHFLARACTDLSKPKPAVDLAALRLLKRHDFPGNVRELRSMVFDAVARHRGGTIGAEAFAEAIGRLDDLEGDYDPADDLAFGSTLPTIQSTVERIIHEALERAEGNQSVAAGMLGISPQALSRRLQRMGLREPRGSGP